MKPRPDVAWYVLVERADVDKTSIFTVSGRLGHAGADELRQRLGQALDEGRRQVVVDLDGADYISSAGLHCLESIADRLHTGGGQLVLCGVRGPVKLALALAGPLTHVVIEPSRSLAIARARKAPSG